MASALLSAQLRAHLDAYPMEAQITVQSTDELAVV